MGGLGPGIGGGEWLVIGLVALLVVGPERLPGLLRQLGKMVAKARGMANEFRSSFDEMARQSELDDLRKEVEALRTGASSSLGPVRLGADADAAFKDIKDELNRPLIPPMTPAPSEWPDGEPVMMPVSPPPLVEAAAPTEPAALPAPKPKARAARPKAPPIETSPPKTSPPKTSPPTTKAARPAASKTAGAKPKAPRAAATKATPAKPRAPRNSKLDL